MNNIKKYISNIKNKTVILISVFIILLSVFLLYIVIHSRIIYENISFDIFNIHTISLCAFRNVTGLPCPGCGITRSYLSMFNGKIKEAFLYHPLFILPFAIAIIWMFKNRILFFKKIYENKYLSIIILTIIVCVYIIRFILLFPNEEPFTYNYSSIFSKVLNLIKNL